MSIKVMTWVWEHSQAKGGALVVLLAIADHASDDGRNAWPTLDALAKKSRMSKQAVIDAIERLEAADELLTQRGRRREGHQDRNVYTVRMGSEQGQVSIPSQSQVEAASRVKFDPEAESSLAGALKDEPSIEPSMNRPGPAPAREEPFGHDPDAAAIAPVHTRWMEACAKATPPISEYIAGSTFGSVLAGYTAAVKGGEPREDVLAAMDELALSLARKPRAVPSRLDIALRVMRARKAEQMTASPSDQHRVAQQRQDEREAERREVWDRAEHIAWRLQNGESVAVPPELVDEVRSCLAGWVGWEQVDAVLAGQAA